jgi:hypothetical protein
MQDASKLLLYPDTERSTQMSLKLGTSLRRALRVSRTTHVEDVHFHSGPGGRVYPCGVHRCESPHLTAAEIGHGR